MIKTINVTKNDIKKGKRCDCRECPVARAINRHLRNGYFAVVEGCILGILHNSRINYGLKEFPKRVSMFISYFDLSYKMKPFKFKLNIHKGYRRK